MFSDPLQSIEAFAIVDANTLLVVLLGLSTLLGVGGLVLAAAHRRRVSPG